MSENISERLDEILKRLDKIYELYVTKLNTTLENIEKICKNLSKHLDASISKKQAHSELWEIDRTIEIELLKMGLVSGRHYVAIPSKVEGKPAFYFDFTEIPWTKFEKLTEIMRNLGFKPFKIWRDFVVFVRESE